MDNKALVSVVMSVFNGEKYLKTAIESILNQTYENFEFIIINDGSSDKSLEIINSYKKNDNRIILLDNKENKGLIYSLNRGLKASNGKYIARMDADDIAFNDRFNKQVYFLENNLDVAVLGTSNNIFVDGFNFIKKSSYALIDCNEIKSALFFRNCMTHPTIMMRNEVIKNNNFEYSPSLRGAEDYGLWCEIAKKYKISNLKDITLDYRLIKTSITSVENKNIENRYEVFKKIYIGLFNELKIESTEKNCRLLFEIQLDTYINSKKYTLEDKLEFLELALVANEENKVYDKSIFMKDCANQFYKLCITNNNLKMYQQSNFAHIHNKSKLSYYKQKIRFIALKNIKRVVR